jgi:hypothetical protein
MRKRLFILGVLLGLILPSVYGIFHFFSNSDQWIDEQSWVEQCDHSASVCIEKRPIHIVFSEYDRKITFQINAISSEPLPKAISYTLRAATGGGEERLLTKRDASTVYYKLITEQDTLYCFSKAKQDAFPKPSEICPEGGYTVVALDYR